MTEQERLEREIAVPALKLAVMEIERQELELVQLRMHRNNAVFCARKAQEELRLMTQVARDEMTLRLKAEADRDAALRKLEECAGFAARKSLECDARQDSERKIQTN